MRKRVAQMLALLMLMPSLVCGMSVCPMSAQIIDVGEKSHCGDRVDKASKAAAKIMMFVDCMGVDLQQSPPHFEFDEPRYALDLNAYTVFVPRQPLGDNLTGWISIRGPPTPAVPEPIYLITQRLRL